MPATECRISVFPERPYQQGPWRIRFDRIEARRKQPALLQRLELQLPRDLVMIGVKELEDQLHPFSAAEVNINGSPVHNTQELHDRCNWFLNALGARTKEVWRTAAEVND